MDERIKALLKPGLLESVDGLELIARIIVEGYMSGNNRSRSIGTGHEFSQYRGYEPGDDLRQLDWKMYARSEKYFIKQAEIETSITVRMMIDGSHSMAYQEDGISKFDFARIMAAALGYLARKQGDAIGLSILNSHQLIHIPPRFEFQHFMRFLHALADARPENQWPEKDLEYVLDHHGKEMIILITDLYSQEEDILKFISRLKTRRNEVIILHLMGNQELTLSMQGTFSFQDLETGFRQQINTSAARKNYIENISAWIHDLKNRFLEKDIHYHLLDMSNPVGDALYYFLNSRKSLP